MSSPALESKSSNLLQLLLCWLLQMAVPSVYQPLPIPVLYTSTLEPGIGSINTWYLHGIAQCYPLQVTLR